MYECMYNTDRHSTCWRIHENKINKYKFICYVCWPTIWSLLYVYRTSDFIHIFIVGSLVPHNTLKKPSGLPSLPTGCKITLRPEALNPSIAKLDRKTDENIQVNKSNTYIITVQSIIIILSLELIMFTE